MTQIKELADEISDELCSAQHYAEMYIEQKSLDESTWATRFKEMATQELVHAAYLHDFALRKIEQISKVYEPPVEMTDNWEHTHKKFVEKTALVKQMLSI